MIRSLAVILSAVFTSAAAGVPLERQDRQDTIYVVHGERSALEAFRTQVGDRWTGGTIVDGQAAKGFLRYWAYSDRTAVEARAFMMPVVQFGLDLTFEQYNQFKSYPSERQNLDKIAIECGAKTDPFFVTPLRSVEITIPENAAPDFTECLTDNVGRTKPPLPLWNSRKGETKN